MQGPWAHNKTIYKNNDKNNAVQNKISTILY